jgi:oxalate decarboxylase/phosphoglucose isomerase-like protein (cupin superfamily)
MGVDAFAALTERRRLMAVQSASGYDSIGLYEQEACEGYALPRMRGPIPPDADLPLQGALKSPPQTHRYRLLAQEPHSIHRFGREWRVGVERFPISQTMTGVVLDLEPGGLRELHWHPNADEWQ